jgi:hypothetical protein
MKALKLTPDEWHLIRQEIDKHHPRSVSMVRWKMREVLGFTTREHEEWLGYYDNASAEDRRSGKHGYKKSIHLDFFDEAKRTMFLLKYGDWIGRKDENW